MSGNPVSIQHQGCARLLSENPLQGTGTHRTSGRQAQTLQAYRTSMREDGAELRLVRRACSRLHLDQNRPHSLADWLLLTLSCYFHDLGLLVTKDESASRDLSNFREFTERVLFAGPEGPDYRAKVHELHEE